MINLYHFHDQLRWWKKFRVVMRCIDVPWFIPGAGGKRKCWWHHICAQSGTIYSWFQILICVYFSIFFIILFYASVCKKDEANLLDPQASKPRVTARRRCSLNLLWCQAGGQGMINILENVVRIPKGDDRFLPWLMPSWPVFKEWHEKGQPIKQTVVYWQL